LIDQILERNREFCQNFITKYKINYDYDFIIENYNKIDLSSDWNEKSFEIRIYFNLDKHSKFDDELPKDIIYFDYFTESNIDEVITFYKYIEEIFVIGQLFYLESFDLKSFRKVYGF